MSAASWKPDRINFSCEFLKANPDKALPVTRGILESAARFNAIDTFTALYRQQKLKREGTR